MPPPNDTPAFHLLFHPKSLFVYQLGTTTPIPPSLLQPLSPATDNSDGKISFRSITWTYDEISIVTDAPPSTFPELKAGTDSSLVLSGPGDWECAAISIRGPMELTLTGILCSLITPLKTAGIPIFTLATWNTDYLLVPIAQKSKTVEALRGDGWIFAPATDPSIN